MRFRPGFKLPPGDHPDGLLFVVSKGKLLVKRCNDTYRVPITAELNRSGLQFSHKQFLGVYGEQHCYAAEPPPAVSPDPDSTRVGPDVVWKDVRALIQILDEELIWIAGRANQLVTWQRSHRFCGKCGATTCEKTDERAIICPRCGLINYPRLSPAVIVAIIRTDKNNEDQILLARGKQFRLPIYSVLAGFVEPGETLEACVRREVLEEVGIGVDQIRYFGSQPWPFPDSLMIAFTARYASGEIRVDDSEILEAAWFDKTSLPRIPASISIARRLIDWFTGS